MCQRLLQASALVLLAVGSTALSGMITIEAEDFDQNIVREDPHTWQLVTNLDGASGTGVMAALPDDTGDNNLGSPDEYLVGPELVYEVNFAEAGIYYVWTRSQSPDSSADSVHMGLNGDTNTADRIQPTKEYNIWVWGNERRNDQGRAFFDVTEAGIHTVHVWMREDGFMLDKFVLTMDPNFVPQEPVVLENFEGDPNLPAWTIETGAENIAVIADPMDPNNQVLQFVTGRTVMTLPWVVEPNAQETLSFRMAYDGDPNLVDNNLVCGAADGQGSEWGNFLAYARMGQQQRIDYCNGNTFETALETTEAMTWYDILLDIDTAARVYDMYVNNIQVVADSAFRSQDPNGIAKVLVRGWDGDYVIFLDDLKVGTEVPEPIDPNDMAVDTQ